GVDVFIVEGRKASWQCRSPADMVQTSRWNGVPHVSEEAGIGTEGEENNKLECSIG
ncbi:unnamed protein product, partial [Urochloa humidicola]